MFSDVPIEVNDSYEVEERRTSASAQPVPRAAVIVIDDEPKPPKPAPKPAISQLKKNQVVEDEDEDQPKMKGRKRRSIEDDDDDKSPAKPQPAIKRQKSETVCKKIQVSASFLIILLGSEPLLMSRSTQSRQVSRNWHLLSQASSSVTVNRSSSS